MPRIMKPLVASLLPLSMAWAAGALPAGGNTVPTPAERAAAKLPRCEIRVDDRGDNVVLEGLVFTRAPVSGSYQLRISQKGGGGSSDIVQSGDFSIGSGETGSLGIVSLSMSTKRYVAKLSVQWDDGAPDCKAGAPKSAKQKLLEQEHDVPGPMSGRLAAGSALAAQGDLDLMSANSE
jgi:hypothetical protein